MRGRRTEAALEVGGTRDACENSVLYESNDSSSFWAGITIFDNLE